MRRGECADISTVISVPIIIHDVANWFANWDISLRNFTPILQRPCELPDKASRSPKF